MALATTHTKEEQVVCVLLIGRWKGCRWGLGVLAAGWLIKEEGGRVLGERLGLGLGLGLDDYFYGRLYWVCVIGFEGNGIGSNWVLGSWVWG